MIKLVKKELAILAVIVTIVMAATVIIPNVSLFIDEVYAVDMDPSSISGTDSKASGFASDVGKTVLGVVQAAGVVISVIILVVLGIKYMLGSAEEKAEYKKSMIPYIVGAVIIFAAAAIAGFISSTANSLAGSSTI